MTDSDVTYYTHCTVDGQFVGIGSRYRARRIKPETMDSQSEVQVLVKKFTASQSVGVRVVMAKITTQNRSILAAIAIVVRVSGYVYNKPERSPLENDATRQVNRA